MKKSFAKFRNDKFKGEGGKPKPAVKNDKFLDKPKPKAPKAPVKNDKGPVKPGQKPKPTAPASNDKGPAQPFGQKPFGNKQRTRRADHITQMMNARK